MSRAIFITSSSENEEERQSRVEQHWGEDSFWSEYIQGVLCFAVLALNTKDLSAKFVDWTCQGYHLQSQVLQ